jgi:alpha-beta hydrolase superfamily lysophospholipase
MLRRSLRLPAGELTLSARVIADPSRVDRDSTIVCCFPGGGMSARYFEIEGYDMAAHLARAGHVVVLVDHPAVGDSDVPDDPWVLTAEVVADADVAAAQAAIDGLRAGTLVDGLPGLPAAPVIGCGHSMGAMLVAYQQARHHLYDAVVLLGHSGRGLPEVLTPEELAFAGDADGARAHIVELAKARFGNPLPIGTTDASEFLVGPDAPRDAIDAIGATRSHLLACPGLTSMIPGSHDPELAAIDVPALIALGEFDIAGEPNDAPAWLSGSKDVTLYVQPGAFHNANIAPNRTELWNRIVDWIAERS